jgi:hypothetical protein
MIAIVLGPVATTRGAGGFAGCGLTLIDPWTASRVIRDFRDFSVMASRQYGRKVALPATESSLNGIDYPVP